jgi:hypothetical protein
MSNRRRKSAVVSIGLLLIGSASIVDADEPPAPLETAAVRVACKTTDFVMEPGQVDQAVVVQDPARQQTVLFDITAGGAIVSLKYKGIEHIWGWNRGAMLQMAIHHVMGFAKWGAVQGQGDYNPTQAGDEYSNSPVTGVGCEGTSSIDIVTMMLDFNNNASFYRKPLLAVWGGQVNSGVPGSYFAPYTLETRASWVRSRASSGPEYYLRLKERIVHLTRAKIGPFGYDFADYEPWAFAVPVISPKGCPCSTSSTNYMAGGLYTDETLNTGLAIAIPGSDFPHNKVSGALAPDYQWRMQSFHLQSREALDGVTAKDFTWYVMAGPWRDALSFAQSFGKEGGAR